MMKEFPYVMVGFMYPLSFSSDTVRVHLLPQKKGLIKGSWTYFYFFPHLYQEDNLIPPRFDKDPNLCPFPFLETSASCYYEDLSLDDFQRLTSQFYRAFSSFFYRIQHLVQSSYEYFSEWRILVDRIIETDYFFSNDRTRSVAATIDSKDHSLVIYSLSPEEGLEGFVRTLFDSFVDYLENLFPFNREEGSHLKSYVLVSSNDYFTTLRDELLERVRLASWKLKETYEKNFVEGFPLGGLISYIKSRAISEYLLKNFSMSEGNMEKLYSLSSLFSSIFFLLSGKSSNFSQNQDIDNPLVLYFIRKLGEIDYMRKDFNSSLGSFSVNSTRLSLHDALEALNITLLHFYLLFLRFVSFSTLTLNLGEIDIEDLIYEMPLRPYIQVEGTEEQLNKLWQILFEEFKSSHLSFYSIVEASIMKDYP